MDLKIRIRPAKPEDAEKLLAIYAPYVEQTAITFEYEVPTVEEFRERIHNTLKKYPYLVAEQGGEPVGYAYVGPFHDRPAYDWAVETSIYVDQNKTEESGLFEYECLHCLSGAEGRIPDPEQCGVPCPSRIPYGGAVPPMWL